MNLNADAAAEAAKWAELQRQLDTGPRAAARRQRRESATARPGACPGRRS